MNHDKSDSKDSSNRSRSRMNQDGSYENEYKKLGYTDKYCEEFMYFLDDDPSPQMNGEASPLTNLIAQIGTESLNEEESKQESNKKNFSEGVPQG